MNQKLANDSASASTKGSTKTQRSSSGHGSLGRDGSVEGNRRAATILEVLGGLRTPSEAAEVLKISVTHYYVLERKALEPGRMGRPPKTPGPVDEEELAGLRAENEALRHELQVAGVRQEIAAVLPQVVATSAESLKKTTSAGHRGTRTCVKRSSSRHKPRRP